MNRTADKFRNPLIRVLVGALVGILVSVGGMVHAGERAGETMHDPVSRMSQVLELSVEQQQDIRGLLQSHRDESHSAHHSLREEIRARLSPEQQERFDSMGASRTGGQAWRPGQRRTGAGMAARLDALELTEEQRTALRMLLAEHRSRMWAERAAGIQAGEQFDRAGQRAAWRALRSEIEQILTDEQVQQLREHRAGRGEGRAQRPLLHMRDPVGASAPA
jgi:Spy/CpxP family protein refolding chaperone